MNIIAIIQYAVITTTFCCCYILLKRILRILENVLDYAAYFVSLQMLGAIQLEDYSSIFCGPVIDKLVARLCSLSIDKPVGRLCFFAVKNLEEKLTRAILLRQTSENYREKLY